jgi:hypothetical protein
LKALRGIVRLQAIVRGRFVRRQLAVTVKCMNALLRVQERARERRARSSSDGRGSQDALAGRNSAKEDAEVRPAFIRVCNVGLVTVVSCQVVGSVTGSKAKCQLLTVEFVECRTGPMDGIIRISDSGIR